MRPDVGTQSLAVSMLERFDTSLFTRQHAVAATARATKAAMSPAMATAHAFSTSDFLAPFLEPPLNPRSRIAWSQPASHVVSTASRRDSIWSISFFSARFSVSRYAYWLAQPYRRGLSDSRPTIRAYREAYATLKDLPGRAREGQFGAVNRVVGAWDVYRRSPFTICGGVLLAAAPFLSKGN